MSRDDLKQLSPVVVVIITVLNGLLLGLFSTAIIIRLVAVAGLILLLATMATMAEALTLVSASLPVMMIAFRGALGVHVLAGHPRQVGSKTRRIQSMWYELRQSGFWP